MLQDNIAKQIIDFQKTAFDKSYGALVMLQDQAQVAFNTVLEQTPWVPEESKKVIDEWVQMSETSRDAFKNLIDDGFETLTGLYAAEKKPVSKKAKVTKTKKAE